MTEIHYHEFEVGGKLLSLESGRVARQAGGAVLLGMGNTVVMATATMSEKPREGIDFLPLVCDYEERKYSVGKIPGGFVKRGGRPSEKAVLVSRLIDRPLRPLFPKGLRNEVQVIAMPFAVEQDSPPDVLAITAAGAALAVSDVPFKYPVAGVRVGLVDGEFVLYPTQSQIKESALDLVVAGHKHAISMVEAGAVMVSEDVMTAALTFAHDAIKAIVAEIEKFAETAGKPKREVSLHAIDEELKKAIDKKFGKDIQKALLGAKDKAMRESALDDIIRDVVEKMKPDYAEQPELARQLPEAADSVVKGVVRELILKKDTRPDGRGLEEIRPLEAIAGILPVVHGSGLFSRGQTQVLTVATLGLPNEAQTLDGLEDEEPRRYMHFYNFPPYSVGEVRPLRGPGRREVGHGALAERALRPVIPLDDPQFPYTLLLVSEVLESNGSTSMASVCGSTLALMDAGIQIKAPVAGIAMGLMSDGKVFKVLTDIQGMEDFCGDMDFKVAGTREGITALQLDTKLDGIPDDVLQRALAQARTARLQILDVIEAEIAEPRSTVGETAPQVRTIQINPEKIGALIGPGGATIKKITGTTGASIDVQQDGRVLVGGPGGKVVDEAIAMIQGLTDEVAVGSEFKGTITRIIGRGALVEILPGKEGMVPKDRIAARDFGRIEEVVNVGDELNLKVFEVDGMGRINLTALGLPQTLETLAGNAEATDPGGSAGGGERRERGGFGRGGDRRDRGDRGDRHDRNDRYDRRDRGPREERPAREDDRAPAEVSAPRVPEAFPKRERTGDDDVNTRFRPRR
jgi:polyribonucleotide nucleotidyltransferase